MAITKKKSLFAAIGVLALESYDFIVFIFLARLVTSSFFQIKLSGYALILDIILALLARPLGGIAFGSFADKYGRKPLLVLTTFLMGVVTFLIAFVPLEQGHLSPALPYFFIVLRALQGMIFGADVLVTTVYLLEMAPKEKRGFYAAFSQIGQDIGVMLAILVSIGFFTLPSKEFMNQIGWRIAFISGSLSMLCGLHLRYYLHETIFFQSIKQSKKQYTPLFELWKKHKLTLLQVFSIVPVLGVSFYLFRVYFLNQSQAAMQLDHVSLMLLSFLASAASILSTAAGGYLSDICGRKPILIAGAIGILLLSWPVMILMGHPGSNEMVFIRVLVGELIIALFIGLYGGALVSFISEGFATHLRCTALGYTYNTAMSLAAGTLPVLDIYLFINEKSVPMFGLYLGFWALISLFVISLQLPETYRKNLKL